MKVIGSSSLYVKTSLGISFMKKSSPAGTRGKHDKPEDCRNVSHTYDQTLHLVFTHDFHAQRFCYPVVVLESTTACRHNA